MSTSELERNLNNQGNPGGHAESLFAEDAFAREIAAALEALYAEGVRYVKAPDVAQALGLEGTYGEHVHIGRKLVVLGELGVVEKWGPGGGTATWEILDPEER